MRDEVQGEARMNQWTVTKKIDLPPEQWDRLFAPSACLVTITTVDNEGRINAASFGTCVRVCHDPMFIAFTVGAPKDTCNNVLATGEFVVNVPSFEREILEGGARLRPRVSDGRERVGKSRPHRYCFKNRQTPAHR